MNNTLLFSIAVISFLSFQSCHSVTKELHVISKPYTLELSACLRKNPETSVVWKLSEKDTTVHYYKHRYIPMFRLYTPRVTVLDTNYQFIIETSLKSYYKDSLIESNFKRGQDNIHAGQNGFIDSLDAEKLKIVVAYKLKNDTNSSYTIDSTKVEVLLDREGVH